MQKSKLILFGFLIIKFTLQYILIHPVYDLHRDEFLHLDQAHHLAWGYLSVPPLTSWVSYIIHLLGNHVFWVKFFPALFGMLTIYIVWKAIKTIGGNLFAQILGATCVLFSALLRINTLYQPNSFDILSWTTFYFILIKYFKTENSKWLFAAALVFSLGFLNKYNVVFMIGGLAPAILMSSQRNIFNNIKLYQAILVAILLISPNLYWQYQNHYPIFHHLKELTDTQLVNVNRIDFLKNQLLFFLGGLFVIFFGLFALLFYKPFKPYRFLFWSFIFTLVTFIYFKAKSYYAIGIYPIYIAFGSVYLENLLSNGWKKKLQPIMIAIPLLLFIPILLIAFPNKSPEYIVEHPRLYKKYGLLRWEDGKDHSLPQDFADMQGWKELAQKVDSVYLQIPNRENTFILCDNYGQAGAINYYTKHNLQAVSFHADYINWFDLSKTYKNLIRIKTNSENELEKTSPYFNTSILADSITNIYAREEGTKIFVFIDAKIDMNERIKNELEKLSHK